MAIVARLEPIYISGGFAIYVPTADDSNVFLPYGKELVRIENESVVLSPFVAALWTPTNRLFGQLLLAWDFDTNGNGTYANLNNGGLSHVGYLNAETLMQVDAQIGYWTYLAPDNSSLLRALGPFFELHYITNLSDPDAIQANGIVIGDFSGNIDEIDLTAGVVCQIGDNINLSVGGVAPVTQGTDRNFDYQVGVRANIFFGPTARARNALNYLP